MNVSTTLATRRPEARVPRVVRHPHPPESPAAAPADEPPSVRDGPPPELLVTPASGADVPAWPAFDDASAPPEPDVPPEPLRPAPPLDPPVDPPAPPAPPSSGVPAALMPDPSGQPGF